MQSKIIAVVQKAKKKKKIPKRLIANSFSFLIYCFLIVSSKPSTSCIHQFGSRYSSSEIPKIKSCFSFANSPCLNRLFINISVKYYNLSYSEVLFPPASMVCFKKQKWTNQ